MIRVSNLCKSFAPATAGRRQRLGAIWRAWQRRPHPAAVEVLRDVNLTVERGQSVGLVGANGAGKSTLLKLICGVLKPTSGSIERSGTIGAMLELGAGFNPAFTGRENLRLAGTLMGMSPAQLAAREADVLAFADIGDYVDEPVKHYSTGMVVRLGFALITVANPDVLVTDEVLGVGDESFQRKCRRWLDCYIERGGTLLLVSHSMDQVRRLCARGYWLDQGQVRQSGPTESVVDAYLSWQQQRFERSQLSAGLAYQISALQLNGSERELLLAAHGDLKVLVEIESTDDRSPVVAIGLQDQHGTPIYGTTSEMGGAVAQRLAPHRYRFQLEFPALALRPGRYRVNGHAMDPEGLRLFDTVTRDFTISGEADDPGALALALD